jgi:hypothetical protein
MQKQLARSFLLQELARNLLDHVFGALKVNRSAQDRLRELNCYG